MSKDKNLQSVAASLGAVAAHLPSQKAAAPQPAPPRAAAPAGEALVQFSFDLRRSLRKELRRLAEDADMTMRAFVLDALRDKGLSVTEEDLQDLRRREP